MIKVHLIRIMSLTALVLGFSSCTGISASAQEPSCLDCHPSIQQGAIIHAALTMGCISCHSAIDANDIPHKKTNTIAKGLSSEPPELCYGCHDKSGLEGKVTHSPVVGGMCISCHNPHSSDSSKLLTSEPPALCFTCHEEKKFLGKFTHSPVAGGMCTSCHFPHKSDNEKLLQSPIPDLCFNCHDTAGFSKQNIHPPVAGGMCSSCHSSHASDYPAQLLHKINDLCTGCHQGEASGQHILIGYGLGGSHPVEGVPDPVHRERNLSCISCHSPHSAKAKNLFVDHPRTLCEVCHEKIIVNQ